jgi:hypothetical protein
MFLRKKASEKGIPFPGARARSEPFSSSRAHRKCNLPDFAPKSGNNSISAPKSQNYQKSHFWSKNDISAPMAPTLINVMVFLVFWDPFSSFSDFGGKFHHFSAKITFCAKKSQSRPRLLESCSRNLHFWTRKNLEGFFATEECKIWSFFALSARNESYLGF